MILPMKKYAFMVYHKEYDEFLHALRDVGVVHVKENKSVAGNADFQELLAIRKQVKTALDFLQKLIPETPEEVFAPARQIPKEEGILLLEKIEKLQEKKSQLIAEKQSLQKDIDYMQLWGDFSYHNIEKIREAGYVVSFFTCQTSRFDPKWIEEYNAFVVNDAKSMSYFITVTKAGETIEIEAERPKMPDSGLEMLCASSAQMEEHIQSIDNQLTTMAAADSKTLEAFDKSLQDEFNFNKVVVQTERQAEDKVMFLEGWTLTEKATNMEAELDKRGYFYQQLEIQDNDRVPIELKNNSFAKLFEPLTRLYSLPNHTELDPTPLFAPFFMLFFGLCLGDAGYGLLILVACTILKFKVGPDMRPVLTLAQWLGGSTLVVGLLLTATFFGAKLADVALLASVKDYFLTDDRLMQLALGVGLFHIVYGKAVAACKIKKQRGFKYSIGPWAWVFLLTPLLALFGPTILAMFGSPLNIPPFSPILTNILYGIVAVSGAVALLYNSPGKNVFINIGSALWTVYNSLSGMLGDTLSYIRLFAIGLTGGILGSVFNILAIQTTEDLSVFLRVPLMLVILLLGHGINIVLSLIASLVHPLRLVFVEYFRNSQYEGGGIAYVPFKKV